MKRQYTIFKLQFHSPLHLSKGKEDDYGESDTVLHSDTLKSALYVCARQLVDETELGPETSFFERFRISSAYPYYQRELFFPKPMLRLQPFKQGEISEERQAKSHKKVGFLGQQYFEDIIGPNQLAIQRDHLHAGGEFLSNHPDLVGKELKIRESEVQQRVAIPPDYRDDARPYYIDRLYFEKNAGLWFAFEGDETTLTLIEKALKLLGDEGIGTDRAVGNGQFEAHQETLTLQLPDQPNGQLLLSLYCPTAQELSTDLLQASRYGFVKRGGYVASPASWQHLTLRKKSVYMFTEGSYLATTQPLKGKIEDLRPDVLLPHPVWRDGQAFLIPVQQPSTLTP